MQILIATLAEGANVSQVGNLNILGAFSRIFAPSFPATHPAAVLVLRLQLEFEDFGMHRLGVTMEDVDGHKIMTAANQLSVAKIRPGGHHYHDVILQLIGMTFAKPGQFSFLVSWDDVPTPVRVRVDVVLASGPPKADQ